MHAVMRRLRVLGLAAALAAVFALACQPAAAQDYQDDHEDDHEYGGDGDFVFPGYGPRVAQRRVQSSRPTSRPGWGGGYGGYGPRRNTASNTKSSTTNAATTNAATTSSASQLCGRTAEPPRIFGGEEAGLGQFPWQAALFYRSTNGGSERVLCGGALVHTRYVVTAAHCLHPTVTGAYRLTKVRLGEWDTSTDRDCLGSRCAPPHLDFTPESQLLHPSYVARARPVLGARHNEADVALLRLDRGAPYTDFVRPVCLPPDSAAADDLQGKHLVVAGWGLTEEGTSSDRLRQVMLPALPLDTCRRNLNVDIQPSQLCVGGEEGKDSCTGDSGGPLLAALPQGDDYVYQLMGVVSFGGVCGEKDRPAVYTRVAAFLPWLRENMRP